MKTLLEYLVNSHTKKNLYESLFEPDKDTFIEYTQAWFNVFKDIIENYDLDSIVPALNLYKENVWPFDIWCEEDKFEGDTSIENLNNYIIDKDSSDYQGFIDSKIEEYEKHGIHNHELSVGGSGSILRTLFSQCEGMYEYEDALFDNKYDTSVSKQYREKINEELSNILNEL